MANLPDVLDGIRVGCCGFGVPVDVSSKSLESDQYDRRERDTLQAQVLYPFFSGFDPDGIRKFLSFIIEMVACNVAWRFIQILSFVESTAEFLHNIEVQEA